MKKLLIFSLALAFFASCTKEPSAGFQVSDYNPITGEEISFYNNSIDFESVEWDFGDGNTSNEDNPKRTFEAFGTYNVTLTTYSKKEKKTNQITQTITVDKNTEELLVGNWIGYKQEVEFYSNQELVNETKFFLNETEINTKEDGTFTSVAEGGSSSSGSWSYVNDNSFILDGQVCTIIKLTGTEFDFRYSDLNNCSGIGCEDVITIEMYK